jgi:hypothetical protein
MKLFFKGKDGGPESNVTGYWLIECKSLFSIVLLRFDEGSREAYHNHAFNAVSWVLAGQLWEQFLVDHDGTEMAFNTDLYPSLKPVFTARERMHKVYGIARRTWVLSFRGPWASTWREFFDKTRQFVTLTHGRKVVPQGLVGWP